ncbi:MAG: hypothetical protein F9B45_32420 [Phycisphaera sp. RhM]|nr:hypothetical protein [Phycisphaera sp. RhM]
MLDQTDPAATLAIDIYESVSVRVEHKGWRRLFAVIGAIRPLLNRLDRRLESMEDLDMARRHESAMVACRERSRRNIELTESLRLKGKLPDYVEVVVRKIESNASDFIDVEKERKHVRARIRNAIEARATELPRLIKPLTENDRSILVVMLQLDASLAKPETARVIADAALVGDPKRAFKNVMKNKLAISTRGTTGGYLLTDAGKSWGTFLSDCTNAGLDYHNIGFTP